MPNLTNHVPTLETCKKLKELGWEKETVFVWELFDDHAQLRLAQEDDVAAFIIPAPLASEIGEELPESTTLKNFDNKWKCWLDRKSNTDSYPYFGATTQSECLALMWIYLKENKLI